MNSVMGKATRSASPSGLVKTALVKVIIKSAKCHSRLLFNHLFGRTNENSVINAKNGSDITALEYLTTVGFKPNRVIRRSRDPIGRTSSNRAYNSRQEREVRRIDVSLSHGQRGPMTLTKGVRKIG